MGTCKMEKGGREEGRGARSLLREVRADGEAGGPESSQTEDGPDGGPGAAEEGVPLPVVQLHKGVLWGRREEEGRRLIGLAKECVYLRVHSCISWLLDGWESTQKINTIKGGDLPVHSL